MALKRVPVSLRAGLVEIRYTGGREHRVAPAMHIGKAPGVLERLAPPGGDPFVLRGDGECVVLRVQETTTVEVTVEPTEGASINDVQARIEYIYDGVIASSEKSVNQKLNRRSPVEVVLGGHVARVGDVRASPSGWLAGPNEPARIEGFAIRFRQQPNGLTLKYAARCEGATWPLPLVDAGTFVGSRGRASAITEVQLELTDPTQQYELDAEAMFLGSASVAMRGARLSLRGPSGTEQLVGLRLAVLPILNKGVNHSNNLNGYSQWINRLSF